MQYMKNILNIKIRTARTPSKTNNASHVSNHPRRDNVTVIQQDVANDVRHSKFILHRHHLSHHRIATVQYRTPTKKQLI